LDTLVYADQTLGIFGVKIYIDLEDLDDSLILAIWVDFSDGDSSNASEPPSFPTVKRLSSIV